MSNLEIFMANPISISSASFYPRNYSPVFLLLKNDMKNNPSLRDYITGDVKGGSTPPSHLFDENGKGIPFIKTSAVTRHYINVNDLHSINADFHSTALKRSITKPYDVIYTMTGKFMGKEAMCPHIIKEMNMSQNSVVLHTNTREEAAFLTIYLNSQVNRIQVRGIYSITKQKFMNQSKISSLKVIPYDMKYDVLMRKYLDAFDLYYDCVDRIRGIISEFNNDHGLQYTDNVQYGFTVSSHMLDRRMLTANFYRMDVKQTIRDVIQENGCSLISSDRICKGDEIGSANYSEEGIPFIKTSDIINFDIDYEPDCFCPEYIVTQLGQNIRKGDIIFAKDGKPGEVALIGEDGGGIISSGLVKYSPQSDEEGCWIFLLLASKYGDAYFKKWFVLGSTMYHLRKDFFEDFKIPNINGDLRRKYIKPMELVFQEKWNSYKEIKRIKEKVEESFVDKTVDLREN